MSLGLSFGLIIFQCQTSLIDVAFVLIILDWHDDWDNHGVILVDGVDALEIPICKSDRRETSL